MATGEAGLANAASGRSLRVRTLIIRIDNIVIDMRCCTIESRYARAAREPSEPVARTWPARLISTKVSMELIGCTGSVPPSFTLSHVVSIAPEPSRFYPPTPIGPLHPDLDNRRQVTALP